MSKRVVGTPTRQSFADSSQPSDILLHNLSPSEVFRAATASFSVLPCFMTEFMMKPLIR